MFTNDTTSKALDLMQRGMGASVLREQVLSNNIANATTPNYKRRDVNFQAQLQRAINSEKQEVIPFKMSKKNHIPVFRAMDYKEVKPNVFTEYYTYQNNNGNSVDIEKEMSESTKNTMYYNALAQWTAKKYSNLKDLLRWQI